MDIQKFNQIVYEYSDTISYVEVLIDYCKFHETNGPINKMLPLLEMTQKELIRHLDDLEYLNIKS